MLFLLAPGFVIGGILGITLHLLIKKVHTTHVYSIMWVPLSVICAIWTVMTLWYFIYYINDMISPGGGPGSLGIVYIVILPSFGLFAFPFWGALYSLTRYYPISISLKRAKAIRVIAVLLGMASIIASGYIIASNPIRPKRRASNEPSYRECTGPVNSSLS
jgi:hypothetical protein